MNDNNPKLKLLLEDANNDPNILSVILSGSRASGQARDESDYDLTLIVADASLEKYTQIYEEGSFAPLEIVVRSNSDFKTYADWGTPDEWDRPDFIGAKVLLDKNGDIGALVQDKGSFSLSEHKELVARNLDSYIDHVFRSTKCLKSHNHFAAHLYSSRSVSLLLMLLFAFHNRLTPFPSRLEKELKDYPLEKMSWNSETLIEKVQVILKSGDIKTQKEFLEEILKLAQETGFDDVVEGWKGKL